jgi:hypothetical protein
MGFRIIWEKVAQFVVLVTQLLIVARVKLTRKREQ